MSNESYSSKRRHTSTVAIRNVMRHLARHETPPPYTREVQERQTKAAGDTTLQIEIENAAAVLNDGHAVKPIETNQQTSES